jgi:hypothetical protein
MNWSERLVHVPFVETHGAYVNVWEKLFFASQDERISERFLFPNDDIYVMKPFDAGERAVLFTPASRADTDAGGDMVFAEIPRTYQKMLRKTLDALKRRGLTCLSFRHTSALQFRKGKSGSDVRRVRRRALHETRPVVPLLLRQSASG